jgi:hypothetical protein
VTDTEIMIDPRAADVEMTHGRRTETGTTDTKGKGGLSSTATSYI